MTSFMDAGSLLIRVSGLALERILGYVDKF